MELYTHEFKNYVNMQYIGFLEVNLLTLYIYLVQFYGAKKACDVIKHVTCDLILYNFKLKK